MRIDLIRPQLKTTIGLLAGAGTVTQWRDEPRNFPNPGTALILLHLASIIPHGVDERIYPTNDAPDELEDITETIHEVREATLRITCESAVQTDDGNALVFLERIRSAFSRKSVAKSLNDSINCAVIKTFPTQDLTAILDNRQRSIAALDVRLRFATLEVGDTLPFIETVEVTGP